MPTTRKKVIKTVYKDEDDSEAERNAGDFSDSGSEAQISEQSSSENDFEPEVSSAEEFDEKPKKKLQKSKLVKRKPKFAKEFVSKINKQVSPSSDVETDIAPSLFSVKDLTDADKLLPSVLNLSESDSSEDESPRPFKKQTTTGPTNSGKNRDSESETELIPEYKDVWLHNIPDNSDEVAKKTFMELEQHKAKIEETKASILNYSAKSDDKQDFSVQDLLAQGEEKAPQLQGSPLKKKKSKKVKDDSDSDMEDWEEVKESKGIPLKGLQLVVGIPDAVCRRSKKLDIEMMMKRKINRVKKENQVYMHKVHVLCWLGHGNFVSRVLNDQEILAAALSLVPSKDCYPGERVDMKYVEQITSWYKDKLTLKQDKYEDKFRPKAPPLKEILITQMKSRVVTTKKYLVFIFVSMLRALGLQCRVMFNFVTLPIRPPTSELCSLSTKPKEDKTVNKKKEEEKKEPKKRSGTSKDKSTNKIPQVDGNFNDSESEIEKIMQIDGNDDLLVDKPRNSRTTRATKNIKKSTTTEENEDVSPPKRAKKSRSPKPKTTKTTNKQLKLEDKMDIDLPQKTITKKSNQKDLENSPSNNRNKSIENKQVFKRSPEHSQKSSTESNKKKELSICKTIKMEINDAPAIPRKTRTTRKVNKKEDQTIPERKGKVSEKKTNVPEIIITNENEFASKYFDSDKSAPAKKLSLSRKRSQTTLPSTSQKPDEENKKTNSRTRSAPGSTAEKSKYFNNDKETSSETKKSKTTRQTKLEAAKEDVQRVSHRELLAKNKPKPKNDVKDDLIGIIRSRVKEALQKSKRGKVKDKLKEECEEDSDYLPIESPKRRNSESGDDFKPTKISPRPSTSSGRKRDRRILSSDEETPKNKSDVWCEIYVEELEQWICVDVIKGKVHCTNHVYNSATHPVCYVVGWDNNNYLKDLTRRYVPHWNTVTRKQRAEVVWWDAAVHPWLGPKSARDREEDEQLNRMQLEAPLPKSITEYKNHPLYALKRHLLKFEAIYPPDAATLGFVRGEPVYARECVYICRSRDTWLKEAKVVRLGEQPYKVVKARPKWDKLSNKVITDKLLEVFGPWQVQDYEPPVAENGIVPRNAYGNVELFKDCMLPIGTVHIKLPGLNRVAKKLNIDCAPAMTGFDFNGGWSHPVYDGFVVCKEYEEVVTEAWLNDQEDQERREREKIETRVYGNWRRLIKGLFIRERLKNKYGFEKPAASTSQEKSKKGPRLVVKKK